MTNRKRRRMLAAGFGRAPSRHYFPGDMEQIRAYSDFRTAQETEVFHLDEITWSDLELDRLYRRVNCCLSTSGEQYLYYLLRTPAVDRADYDARRALITSMQEQGALRLKLQMILSRLGRSRRADLCQAFHPAQRGPFWLIVYLLLALLVPASAVLAAVLGAKGLLAPVFAIVCNMLVHEIRRRRCQRDFDTVNYTVSMVFALNRMRRLRDSRLDAHLRDAYDSLDRLRSVLRTGGLSAVHDDSVGDLLSSVFLLDLIAYEFLKNKFGRCHTEVFRVHEALGQLDAAIAAASFRESLPTFCEPELDFSPGHAFIDARGMVHPLLPQAVPNDLCTARPILITGSNASGKSTYLKTAALCALLAQTLCTCTAQSYRASAVRLFTSMALKDDLLAGESYYIVEVRSLRRIMEQTRGTLPLLCAVDEVLRGTNTVERIAASSEILQQLAQRGALCLAATHDIELCGLLQRQYALFHFEEQLGENEMLFDYKLRPGPAASRNAIDLLKLMGFDQTIVAGAHARANGYLQSGVWKNPDPGDACAGINKEEI